MAAAHFSVLILLLLSSLSVFNLQLVAGQKTWCVARPSSDAITLQKNIDYACSQPNVDCNSVLQKGCACSVPDTLLNHASLVMNLYYQANGRNFWNCDFANTGFITYTDPSYGGCIFQQY